MPCWVKYINLLVPSSRNSSFLMILHNNNNCPLWTWTSKSSNAIGDDDTIYSNSIDDVLLFVGCKMSIHTQHTHTCTPYQNFRNISVWNHNHSCTFYFMNTTITTNNKSNKIIAWMPYSIDWVCVQIHFD